VLSTQPAPANQFVKLTSAEVFSASRATMTFLRVSDGQVFTEPLVPIHACPAYAWTHFEFESRNGFEEYLDHMGTAFAPQMVPASIASTLFQYRDPDFEKDWMNLVAWRLATRHRFEKQDGLGDDGVAASFKYHCKFDEEIATQAADVVDVYEIDNEDAASVMHIQCLGVLAGKKKLVDVSTYSNFVGYGEAPESVDVD
jgi:hypothetical protein